MSNEIDEIFASKPPTAPSVPSKVYLAPKKTKDVKSSNSSWKPQKGTNIPASQTQSQSSKKKKRKRKTEEEEANPAGEEEWHGIDSSPVGKEDTQSKSQSAPSKAVVEVVDATSRPRLETPQNAKKKSKLSSTATTLKKKAAKGRDGDDDDDASFRDSRGTGPRRKTEEGYRIFKEDELGITDVGGDTPLCPFDCDCCF